MKTEEEIRDDSLKIEEDGLKAACDAIRQCDIDVQKNLAEIVASICEIDYDTMMGDEKRYYTAQCRWMFWHAYRYMTNEPYVKMAERLGKYGHKFSVPAIITGVNKMARMIEQDTIWKKRWIYLKRIIKVRNDSTYTSIPEFMEPTRMRIVVYKPANVDCKIEFREEV